jgi:hypothetical protein
MRLASGAFWGNAMKQLDEPRLESDLTYRYDYLAEFIGFTDQDVKLIHALTAKLLPQIASIVDATYDKLLSYVATARHFLPRQNGYDGPLPDRLEALSQDNEQIQFRKEHLRRYLMTLIGNPYDERMIKYLDVVGKMHTPKTGNKQIDVPLVQMNALMGLLSDLMIDAICQLELDRSEELATLRAFNKLLWIQNDLINRHYAADAPIGTPPPTPATPPPTAAWQ